MRYQWRATRAFAASLRPYTNVQRMDCRDCTAKFGPGNAYLINGLLDARRTKNRDCKTPGGSPRFWSDTVNLKGTASANSFAASQLVFSRELRSRRTVATTRLLHSSFDCFI